jgi:glycosyltransferase involved in cell wall biosynthesis
MPRVLFVSKPIAAPFHDGTKCLVRDVSRSLTRYDAVVMGTRAGVPDDVLDSHVGVASVYADSGAFAPALAANARAAAWLVLRARADVWHFVFAPNPRTSTVARVALALRRVPSLQTVASPPQQFSHADFFGKVVVAQSTWTRDRILQTFAEARREPPRLEVIPPPVAELAPPSRYAVDRVRAALTLPDGVPVFVYPGDLEVSRGASRVAAAVPEIVRQLENAVVVFACRHKTPAAAGVEAELRARLDPRSVRFTREVNLPALLSTSTAVLFPVDDLRGKVDLPISLLEAMSLGVPVVTVKTGPLADLDGVLWVDGDDPAELARAAIAAAGGASGNGGAVRARVIAEARNVVVKRFDSAVVAAAYERLYDSLLGG